MVDSFLNDLPRPPFKVRFLKGEVAALGMLWRMSMSWMKGARSGTDGVSSPAVVTVAVSSKSPLSHELLAAASDRADLYDLFRPNRVGIRPLDVLRPGVPVAICGMDWLVWLATRICSILGL